MQMCIRDSGYVSYANCGLPYYIGGEITDREALTLQTPESFFRRFRIDVRTGQEALRIDRKEKRVLVHNLADGSEYTESYDKLILSPGARPLIPDISGTDAPGVFHLRTVEDTFRIYDYICLLYTSNNRAAAVPAINRTRSVLLLVTFVINHSLLKKITILEIQNSATNEE